MNRPRYIVNSFLLDKGSTTSHSVLINKSKNQIDIDN